MHVAPTPLRGRELGGVIEIPTPTGGLARLGLSWMQTGLPMIHEPTPERFACHLRGC